MTEGMAEYVAYEAMIKRGSMRRADVQDFMLSSARYTGALARPLQDFGGTGEYPLWPGHVGYVALDRLVPNAPKGILALRTVCEAVGGGASFQSAFLTAFGVSVDDFYTQFEIIRQQLK